MYYICISITVIHDKTYNIEEPSLLHSEKIKKLILKSEFDDQIF